MDNDQNSLSDSSSSLKNNKRKNDDFSKIDEDEYDSEQNNNYIQNHSLSKKKRLIHTRDVHPDEIKEASSEDNERIANDKSSEEKPKDSYNTCENYNIENLKNEELEDKQIADSLSDKNFDSIHLPLEPINKKKLLHQMRKEAKQNYIELVSKEVGKIIKYMNKAYEDDFNNYSKGKQAISKLILLPKLENLMNNASKNSIFISHHLNGLDAIAKWLRPYKDGKFPLSDLLLRIIKLLNLTTIKLEDLSRSSIGKAMGSLITSGKVDNEVVKQGSVLLDKWQSIVVK